uniref:Uncharacterized protein n=1 Tax=Vibrio sp. 23023 TaxID=452803 RepID=A9M4Q3_9VIBR|nr:Conserved hypothetical protein [Vibrio sp. 23023]
MLWRDKFYRVVIDFDSFVIHSGDGNRICRWVARLEIDLAEPKLDMIEFIRFSNLCLAFSFKKMMRVSR